MTAMPIYEFECAKCGSRFEELMESGAEAPACPECSATGARRRLSPVSPPERITPRGAKARDSESRRREREAARSDRIADAQKARKGS
jgi:putative FmdB family regulatory protein